MVKDNVLLCSEHSQRISNESQFVQVSSERILRLNARKTCTSLYWSLTLSLCNSRKDNKFKMKILSRTGSFMPLAFISNFQELKNIHSYAHSALSTRPMSGCLCGPAPLSSPRCPVSTPAWLCIIGHEFLLPALTPELGQTVNNNVSGSHRSQGGRLTVSKQLCACFIACYWSIMVSGWRSWQKR